MEYNNIKSVLTDLQDHTEILADDLCLILKSAWDELEAIERLPEPDSPSTPLEYEDWCARPCINYDECPVKNKNIHCYVNKPCFK